MKKEAKMLLHSNSTIHTSENELKKVEAAIKEWLISMADGPADRVRSQLSDSKSYCDYSDAVTTIKKTMIHSPRNGRCNSYYLAKTLTTPTGRDGP